MRLRVQHSILQNDAASATESYAAETPDILLTHRDAWSGSPQPEANITADPDCGNMNPNKATQETESQALSQGYEACKKCW